MMKLVPKQTGVIVLIVSFQTPIIVETILFSPDP